MDVNAKRGVATESQMVSHRRMLEQCDKSTGHYYISIKSLRPNKRPLLRLLLSLRKVFFPFISNNGGAEND